MAAYEFQEDLKNAQMTEHLIFSWLKENKYNPKEFNDDYRYDIICDNGMKFEVKEDFFNWKTHNIAFEFESRGKKSGIMTSHADYYIYCCHNEKQTYLKCYMIEHKKIINAVNNNIYKRIVSGGDAGSYTMIYLFKEYTIRLLSEKIFEVKIK